MTNKYYLIFDQNDCWAASEDLESAWADIAEMVEHHYNDYNNSPGFDSWDIEKDCFDGTLLEYAKSLEIYEHDSKNGKYGFFVVELERDKLPKNFKEFDGLAWCEFYRQQQELAQG